MALEAIGRLEGCEYFEAPVPLTQFCLPGFVTKVVQGKYDEIHEKRRPSGRPDERPPPQAFKGGDAERFEATKRALAQKMKDGAA